MVCPPRHRATARGISDADGRRSKKGSANSRSSVSFVGEAGVTALFGPSGAGKTSIINMIAGLMRPDRGRIALDGDVLFDAAARINVPAWRRRIGYVFQEGRLFPHLSVQSQSRLRPLDGRPRRPTRRRSRMWSNCSTSAHLLDRRPGKLSGGERQRVAVGRALLMRPRLLLLDEPLASLDAARKQDILPYLSACAMRRRVPMIYVSHDAGEVRQHRQPRGAARRRARCGTGGVELLLTRVAALMFPPSRIVCLTEETVETLYLLGEEARIVGVSGYAVRPPRVRKEKPRVSAFISADVPKILALKPDLVLTFSDLQADIVADLVRANIAVHAFNQRDVAGIFDMIRTLGALVGCAEKADALARQLAARVDAVHERALCLPRQPRVYFEEWDEPMISGLGWVSELIEAAGGIEVFPQLAIAQERQATGSSRAPR